jgi:hypothetical protein
MAKATKQGRALAMKLNPFLGTTVEIVEVCSLIARHAATYQAIQEARCSVPMTDSQLDWTERREQQIERRIRALVERLPHTDEGPIRARFSGDPRGWCVQLVLPGSLASHHEGWGRDGIFARTER